MTFAISILRAARGLCLPLAGDAPDRIAHIIGDEEGAIRTDRHADRPSI
jgi:hypothetical protein